MSVRIPYEDITEEQKKLIKKHLNLTETKGYIEKEPQTNPVLLQG